MFNYTGKELDKTHWAQFDKFCEKRVFISEKDPKIKTELKDADAIFAKFSEYITLELIDATPNLKYIGTLATAYGRIDAAYAAKKGITVCNIPGYSTESVAEFTFAVLLEHLRALEKGKVNARNKNYSESEFFEVSEIKGKNIGIIGLGQIGTRIAEIASDGFKAKVSYWNRTRKDVKFNYLELDKLISTCDIISLNLALTKDTEKILNTARINKIKPGAIVINTAPMDLIDIKALAERLKKKDVIFIWDHSDEVSKETLKLLSNRNNCIIYPPIGYTTKEAAALKQEIFIKNIESFLKGKPQSVVN